MATACDPSSEGGNVYSSTVARRQRSKELAQKRRTTYKGIMDDLTQALPFPKDVVLQLDYNSKLRLALCFFRLKSLVDSNNTHSRESEVQTEVPDKLTPGFSEGALMKRGSLGLMQDFLNEALDGFLMVALTDGTITFLSESIHKHLGLFQSEHIGISLYDLVLESDHESIRNSIHKAELTALARLGHSASAEVGFFCRMKCSRFKVTNTISKTPGYKLVYISGTLKVSGNETYLIAVARPVSPPSIMEIKVEGNMFVTHYSMEMKCTFFDGRLFPLMGYHKKDLLGDVVFTLHHHDDTEATMECSKGVMSRGEGLSGYFRFLTKHGFYLWLQTRATVMHDSRTGKPSYILCMNFVISKEVGDEALRNNATISAALGRPAIQETDARSHDPFPLVSREDGRQVNPLNESKDIIKSEFEVSSSSEIPTPETARSIKSSLDSLVSSSEPDSSSSDLGIARIPTGRSLDSGYISGSGEKKHSTGSQFSNSPQSSTQISSPENPPSVFSSPLGSISSNSSNGVSSSGKNNGQFHTQLPSEAPNPLSYNTQQNGLVSNGTGQYAQMPVQNSLTHNVQGAPAVVANGAPQLSAMLSNSQYNGQSSTVLGKRTHTGIKLEDPMVQIPDFQPSLNGGSNAQQQSFSHAFSGAATSAQFLPQEQQRNFAAQPQRGAGNGPFQNGGFVQDGTQGTFTQHGFLPAWNEDLVVKDEHTFSHMEEILPNGFATGLVDTSYSPPPLNFGRAAQPNFPLRNDAQFSGYSGLPTQRAPNMPAQQFPSTSQQFSGMPTQQDLPQLTGEDLKILDDIGGHF